MQKIIIERLGPVKFCQLELNDFTVFTGPQASGKSTIAKSIFFFKNIKNLLYTQFMKHNFFETAASSETLPLSLKSRLEREIRSNFLQIFGSTWHMDRSMCLEFQYKEDISIRVSLKDNVAGTNYIWLDFSEELENFISMLEKNCHGVSGFTSADEMSQIKEQIGEVFGDTAEIVYIPAGRSMITLLSAQLNYIYSSMDDSQRKNLDYCTQNYLERILQLKPFFSQSVAQMIQDTLQLTDTKVNKGLLDSLADAMKNILQGEYRNVGGEERLQVSERQYVKINFASSGQQEAVWILNVIFYYLLNNKKTFFIIEEPESHLFPNAQKRIAEFISMAKNGGRNQMFITTHSPYILGTFNNLLYADKISGSVDGAALDAIVSRDKWLPFSGVSAYFIENGEAVLCTDGDFQSIESDVIDGASVDINRDYEQMVLLKEQYQTGKEA